ncbi:MAG: hypothetical protein DHS20C19_08400 [Acidimicrobiales bacterium]|nr:MAG: hypothetical protein DHS20C19_08400 [Acidimicrobiales bacterium]
MLPRYPEEGVALVGASSYYEMAAEGRQLTVHAIVGDQSYWTGHDLRVIEITDAVMVELVSHRRTDTKFCTLGDVFFAESHVLTDPLGQRRVIDRVSGESVMLRDW